MRAALPSCVHLCPNDVPVLTMLCSIKLEAGLVVPPTPLAPPHLGNLRLYETFRDLNAYESPRLKTVGERQQTAPETDVLNNCCD